MPAGELVTEPPPEPALEAESKKVPGAGEEKPAVTDRAWLIVTWQVPVPLQPAPLQPVKLDRDVGVAVSVTGLASSYVCAQVAPQSIPPTSLVTVPLPAPAFATIRS